MSVHRESNLITVQQDKTYSVIIVLFTMHGPMYIEFIAVCRNIIN